MRRLVALLVGATVAVAVVVAASGGGAPQYRVAAIFDVARGIVPGQQVKVAGVAVGQITDVQLAPGPKARIVMELDRRFAPFRTDASCTILPEGLLSENFVSCEPGTFSHAPLASSDGLPTVPVSHTTVPASLQELLDVFSLPTDDRLRVLIDGLGIATAGRGEDLNAVLYRSNPALTQAQRVLGVINRQRQQLATGVGQTNRVLASISNPSARALVDRAAEVAQTIAIHRVGLSESLRRLPPLLSALRPGLSAVDRTLASGSPLLGELQASAPEVNAITNRIPSFLAAATPALHSLSAAATAGHPAMRAATPVVRDLRKMSATARGFAPPLDSFLINLRNSGAIEGTLASLYTFAVWTDSYDTVSHLAGVAIRPILQCVTVPSTPGCRANYNSPGQGTIPANDPACGPQPGAIWDPATNCHAFEGIGLLSSQRRRSRLAGHRRRAPAASRVPQASTRSTSVAPIGGSSGNAGGGLPQAQQLLAYLLSK